MGHFPGRLPVLKGKRELRVLALPPNEVLSQLQFCRAYLSKVWLTETIFGNTNLTAVRGLEDDAK
jgi:hypothetical protein